MSARNMVPILFLWAVLSALPVQGVAQVVVAPVLELPQRGIDDTVRYRDYMTKFYRDTDGNPAQIAVNQTSGRVVNLWADAVDESISFTVRDTTGKPVRMVWQSAEARAGSDGGMRTLEYDLTCEAGSFGIGLMQLCSMRWERDFEYEQKHLLPFDSPTFVPRELSGMMDRLARLPGKELKTHLQLLHAGSILELRARLEPARTLRRVGGQWLVSILQYSFDGKHRLSLEFSFDTTHAVVALEQRSVRVRSTTSSPVVVSIRVGTDSPSLHPITRGQIFNDAFVAFYDRITTLHDSLARHPASAGALAEALRVNEVLMQLDRQIKGVELLSFREKLMAGLPNYATYFGRDMMMSALMLEPVWRPEMMEHVIGSVLRKLSPDGRVSHEEALGGQAIREHAEEYSRLIDDYFRKEREKNRSAAAAALAKARSLLGRLDEVRENYAMVDESVQLPVIASRYLSRSDVSLDQKRNFLLDTAGGTSLAILLLRNLSFVEKESEAYAADPKPSNLVSFARGNGHRWISGSWRDSGPGYANGRYPMDVNAIWMPAALEATRRIFEELRSLGFSEKEIAAGLPSSAGRELRHMFENPEAFSRTVEIWRSAYRHFRVTLPLKKARELITARLASLQQPERAFWSNLLDEQRGLPDTVAFLALSLDSTGKPIPVMNSDPSTGLFLESIDDSSSARKEPSPYEGELSMTFTLPYPLGLFIKGVGPVIANDAFAERSVWESFDNDLYHSSRVIWGREVNLFLLGACTRLLRDHRSAGKSSLNPGPPRDNHLRAALEAVRDAVNESGLKGSELWSYSVVGGKVVPVRYPASCDIQLWNLTDLAAQFELDQLHHARGNRED